MLSFFFFKQKTAYDMRISDWSSDVCSSDLFDNHQHCAVTHHQIEFTATETDIACDQLQSATLEQAQRRVLGVGPVHGVSGCSPSLPICTQLSLRPITRSEEHTSELQSLMRHSYAGFCLKKKPTIDPQTQTITHEKQETT